MINKKDLVFSGFVILLAASLAAPCYMLAVILADTIRAIP